MGNAADGDDVASRRKKTAPWNGAVRKLAVGVRTYLSLGSIQMFSSC